MTKRSTPISFKVSLQEDRFLRELAKKSNFNSVSEYIRARLFEGHDIDSEESSVKNNKKDRDILKLLANSYNIIYKLAEKELKNEDLVKISQKSQDWLKKNGYMG